VITVDCFVNIRFAAIINFFNVLTYLLSKRNNGGVKTKIV